MATYTTLYPFSSGQTLKASGDGTTFSGMNDLRNNLDLVNAQSAYRYRNLLHNAACNVSQRGTSSTSNSVSGYWLIDRWVSPINLAGTWTETQTADAPASSGLVNCLKVNCTSAQASLNAAAYMQVAQTLEGQDVQHLLKGTSAAKALTLTFWVKSNVTGTYTVELGDLTNTRGISATYTIVNSATWEQKSVTFAGDTTGVLAATNAGALTVNFWLAAGTNYTSGTLATSWAAQTAANRASASNVNLASATNNYWQLTGAQLEVGSISTPFEFVQFGEELRRCQRYYAKSYSYSDAPGTNTSGNQAVIMGSTDATSNAQILVPFPVEMRVPPTTTATWTGTGTANQWSYSRNGASSTATTTQDLIGTRSMRIYGNAGAAWVSVQWYGHWTASAEL